MKEEKYCKCSENPEICVKCLNGINVRNKLIMDGISDTTEYWKLLFFSNYGEIISRNCPNSKNYTKTI